MAITAGCIETDAADPSAPRGCSRPRRHTNKQERSAGSRLAHEYALTKDKVFSVAPAFGDGSVIDYSMRAT